jgi:BASS family bile acid:Na+ symporter
MGAMGLRLTVQAITVPLQNVRFMALALALNFVLAPGFAWLLTAVVPLDRGYAIGLMLLGGAAGAPFLPKLVQNARGDMVLAAALMCILTAGTILFLPFALPLMVPGFAANPWSIARPLVLFILLPLVAGMGVKRVASTLAARMAPVLAGLGNASLLVVFVLLIALHFRTLLAVLGSGAVLVALLYIGGLFAVSWLVGGREAGARGVLALATAARNFGAALVPAEGSFQDPKVSIMLIVSAIVCLVVTFLAAGWVRRKIPAAGL